MATLSFSICMSLLHSLWQSALLWLVYVIAEKILQQKFSPRQKKNLLCVSLVVQVVLFVFTFLLYYVQPVTGSGNILLESIKEFIPRSAITMAMPWIFIGYCTVLAFKLAKTIYEWMLFKKQFTVGLVKPIPALKAFTKEHQYRFGINRKVQLWFSTNIKTPLTFGFFKPIIVLPVALVNHVSIQQAEALILHELAHIKANDFLINWFVIAAESVFFFNPFIVSLCNKIKVEREKYCDISVTAFNYSPLLYAEALLKAQALTQLTPQTVTTAVNKPQLLLNRIQFFINPANQLQFNYRKITAGLLSLTLLIITGMCIFMQFNLTGIKNNVAVIPAEKTNAVLQNENNFPVIVNNVLKQITEENLNKIVAAVQKQQPAIEKSIKQLQPLIKNIEASTQKLSEDIANNLITPVSLQENEAVRQVVVREEQSGSENATLKVYNVIFKDGKWRLQPQWKLAAKEIIHSDSSLIDTSEPSSVDSGKEMQ